MRPKVFIEKKVPKEVEDYIGQYCDYRKWDKEEPMTREQFLQEIEDVDGLLTTSSTKINTELLDRAANLKIVSNMSVGYNNFDFALMKDRNVIGTHTPGVLDETVADLVFSLILSTARRIPELDRYTKEGKWEKEVSEEQFGVDVHHKSLGIIGMGRIGEAIARRAKFGFNMDVSYYNRSKKTSVEEEIGVTYADLDSLIESSDFIVLMTPLTKETEKMIGKEQFERMKSTAIFINASRGGTVDEQALIAALKEKQILGAGLDVFSKEPVEKDNPLLQMDNVVAVPHIGSATAKTRADMAMLGAKNLVAAVTGGNPMNIVPELKG